MSNNQTAQCGRCGHEKRWHEIDDSVDEPDGKLWCQACDGPNQCDFSPAAPPPKCECGCPQTNHYKGRDDCTLPCECRTYRHPAPPPASTEKAKRDAIIDVFDSVENYETYKAAFASLKKRKCPCTVQCGHPVTSHVMNTENGVAITICRDCQTANPAAPDDKGETEYFDRMAYAWAAEVVSGNDINRKTPCEIFHAGYKAATRIEVLARTADTLAAFVKEVEAAYPTTMSPDSRTRMSEAMRAVMERRTTPAATDREKL